jgi:hypothetical protein
VSGRAKRQRDRTACGKAGPHTGPTIAGCKKVGSTVTITFNSSLMGGDSMEVQPYNASVMDAVPAVGASQMAVLVNATNFCFQTGTFPAPGTASPGRVCH